MNRSKRGSLPQIVKKGLSAQLPLTVKSSGGGMTVEGYASAFNVVDSDGDLIIPGAYKGTIKSRQPDGLIKFLWQHDHLKPIGVVTSLKEDEYGLKFSAKLANTSLAKEAYELMKAGAVNRFSIGFEISKSVNKSAGALGISSLPADRQIRVIEDVKLWEVSPVTFPANEGAKLTAIKRKGRWFATERKEFADGVFVAWADAEGEVYGQILAIYTEGTIETEAGPLTATEEDPVAEIALYIEEGDGHVIADSEPVFMQLSLLQEIEALPAPSGGDSPIVADGEEAAADEDEEEEEKTDIEDIESVLEDIDPEGEPAADSTPAEEMTPPVDAVAISEVAVESLEGAAPEVLSRVKEIGGEGVVELAEAFAAGEPLAPETVAEIGAIWVEHGEELLSAEEGTAEALAAELLGAEIGEEWILRTCGLMACRGEFPLQQSVEPEETGEAVEAQKAGRALSARNLARLEAALKNLKEVVGTEKRRGNSGNSGKKRVSSKSGSMVDAGVKSNLAGILAAFQGD